MNQTPQPSWWNRNWKWVVPVGCLLPVLVCTGGIGLIFFGVMGALRSSDVYVEAVASAKANPEVQELLGEPIETGFWTTGNIQISGAQGEANLSIPITGPKGSAAIHAIAFKDGGRWEFTTLGVIPDASGQEAIDLLEGESEPARELPFPVD